LLKCGTIFRIGDGESVHIWSDKWILRLTNLKPSRSRGVSQLIREGTNDWDEARVRQFFQPSDVEEILKIKLPTAKQPDSIAWHYEKSGVFSVRSAYHFAFSRALNLEEEGSS
jgi:hypothetical protein